MLKVQVDNSLRAVEANTLARMIFDGEVNRDTTASDETVSEQESVLERFLEQPHREAVCTELLDRLARMYVFGPNGTDPGKLRSRVVELCDWNWDDPVIHGRLYWTAAWLEELTGSLDRAIRFYSEFLQRGLVEPRLTFLAYNNRGALRIRLGRVEGVSDLARAAVGFYRDPKKQTGWTNTGLPAACFNLLNLMICALKSNVLTDQVERRLRQYVRHLPDAICWRWFGLEFRPDLGSRTGGTRREVLTISKQQRQDAPGTPEAGAVAQAATRFSIGQPIGSAPGAADLSRASAGEQLPGAASADGAADEAPGAKKDDLKECAILKAKTLNCLIVFAARLATAAKEVAQGQQPPGSGEEYAEAIREQLAIWVSHPRFAVAGNWTPQERRQQELHHHEYAEAASLLFEHDIPSSLMPHERKVVWLERIAEGKLTQAKACYESRAYEQATSTLQSTLDGLKGIKGSRRINWLRKRAKRLLHAVGRRLFEHRQFQVHGEYTRFLQEIDEFCSVMDLCQVHRASEDLLARLERLRTAWHGAFGADNAQSAQLIEDQVQRINQHLREIEYRDIEASVQQPWRRLQEIWPRSWTDQVPDEASRLLDDCQLHDPDDRIQNWDLVRSRLHAHQAQHLIQQVVADISVGDCDEERIERDLAAALKYNPSLGPAVAPILGMLSIRHEEELPSDLKQIRDSLLRSAAEFLGKEPPGPAGIWNVPVRTRLVQQACVLIRRLFQSFHGVAGDITKLWSVLGSAFAAILEEGRPAMADEIKQMIDVCLDSCPPVAALKGARSDPRNELVLLAEKCQRVRLVGRGEEFLNNRIPDCRKAAECFEQALGLGLERGYLQRAATGLYLARLGTADVPTLQRIILNRLDQWVAAMPDDHCVQIRSGSIAAIVAELRAELRPPEEPPPPETGIPEELAVPHQAASGHSGCAHAAVDAPGAGPQAETRPLGCGGTAPGTALGSAEMPSDGTPNQATAATPRDDETRTRKTP